MKTLNKKILKEGYYYESESFYESLPNKLPKAPKYKTKNFTEWISHRDILKKYNITPYPDVLTAASVTVDLIPTLEKGKGKLVYFNHNGVLHRFNAWRRDDGLLRVRVSKVDLGFKCAAEYGVAFSNSPLESSTPLSLEPSVTSAIELLKKEGYKITKEF